VFNEKINLPQKDAALWQHPLIFLSLQAVGLVLKVKIFHFPLTTFAIWFQGICNLVFHWKYFIAKSYAAIILFCSAFQLASYFTKKDSQITLDNRMK